MCSKGVLKQPLDRCDFVRSSGGILNLWIGRDVTRLRDHCHTFRIDDDGSFGVAVFRRFLLLGWGWLVGYIYIYIFFFPTEMEMDVFFWKFYGFLLGISNFTPTVGTEP